MINVQRAGDVEEIESHAVNKHREQEQPNAGSGITDGKQAEAQHPRQHGNHHHALNAKALHKEGNKQDATGFADLRKRNQNTGMRHAKRVGVFRLCRKTADKRVSVTVGYLQGNAEQHRENEEDGHLALLEEYEGIEAQRLDEALPFVLVVDGAMG